MPTHPNAIEAMRRHLQKTFNECQIKDRLPVFETYYENFKKFSYEVLKHKTPWLSEDNIWEEFIGRLFDSYREKAAADTTLSGYLKDIIEEENFNELLNRFLEFIESIPRRYEFSFVIPYIQKINLERCQFTENFEWFETPPSEGEQGTDETSQSPLVEALLGYRSPASSNKLSHGDVGFIVRSEGYARSSVGDSAIANALSAFKQFVMFGISYGFFDLNQSGAGLKIGTPNLIMNDLQENDVGCVSIELPSNLKNTMSRLKINDKVIKEVEEGPMKFSGFLQVPTTNEEFVKRKLSDSVVLLEAAENDENVISIKSACEWGFDSLDDENETFSFLLLCIALEAILGEDFKRDDLTKSLADRCSYLLGGTIERRRKIREHFTEFYDARSKLVHGREVRLAPDERVHLSWGNAILKKLLRKEFSQYKSSKK